MRDGRKGSMQLSIEAIIILVIAMVLLGLGIGFVQTFFGQAGNKVGGIIENVDIRCSVDSGNPIQATPAQPEVKSGSEFVGWDVCVYAKNAAVDADLRFKEEGCESTLGEKVTPKIITPTQNIARTETGGFEAIIIAENMADDKPLDPATYICTLEAVSDVNGVEEVMSSKQISIKVT